MRLVVDGVVYGFQKHGGINSMFNAVLPRLARIDDVSVELLLPRQVLGEVPDKPVRTAYFETVPEKTGLSWKLDKWLVGPTTQRLNRAFRKFSLGRYPQTVYLSTYFTWPERRVPELAIAYDMNHELFPEWYIDQWGLWLRKQYREYLQRATRVVAISDKTKKDIVKFYDIAPDRIDVVHLAVENDLFYPDTDGAQGVADVPRNWLGNYLLYVGTRSHYKNFPLVLKAISQNSEDLCAGLVVSGDKWTPSELNLINSLGVGDRVHLVHHPSIQQLRRLYSFSLAFVFPSLHEGFGIPLLEAMACRTPVLAADTEVFREIAGDAALFFAPDDPSGLATVVAHVKDEKRRSSLLELGTQRLKQFSWTQCAQQIHDACCHSLRDWNGHLL